MSTVYSKPTGEVYSKPTGEEEEEEEEESLFKADAPGLVKA